MERIPVMKNYLEKKVNELLAKRLRVMEEALQKNQAKLRDKLQEVLSAQAHLVHNHQEYKKLTISYLRSSYITEDHIFLIACQGETLFLEEELPEKEIDFSTLFTEVEADVQKLEEALKQKFIRISDGERETIRRWYMELLYIHLGEVFKTGIQQNGYLTGIPLLYGGYMEEQRQIGWI